MDANNSKLLRIESNKGKLEWFINNNTVCFNSEKTKADLFAVESKEWQVIVLVHDFKKKKVFSVLLYVIVVYKRE